MNRNGFTLVIILLIAVGIVAASAGAYLYSRESVPSGVACTEEAKQCPDGSSVGRIGPNCEFAACPTSKGLAVAIRAIEGAEEKNIENSEVSWYLAPDAACIAAKQSSAPVVEFSFKVDRGDPNAEPDKCDIGRTDIKTRILSALSGDGWKEVTCGVEPPPIIRVFQKGELFAYVDLHKGCAGGAEDSANISIAIQIEKPNPAPANQPTGSTQNPSSTVNACLAVRSATFRSVAKLEGGLGPAGPVQAYWTLVFGERSLTWNYSDVSESGTYACDGSVITFSFPGYTGRASYDAGRKAVVWQGIEYRNSASPGE